MPDNPDLVPALTALFSAKSSAEMRQVLTAHSVLLDPETDAFIRRETANVTIPADRDNLDRILWILKRCREMGIEAHFAEVAKVEPLGNLLREIQKEAKAPKDLNAAPGEDSEPLANTSDSLASLCVAAYRGEDYPYGGAQAAKIKAAGEDHYLVLLARRNYNEKDWARAAQKIEDRQRAEARKYIAELAKRNGDSSLISRIGFEFIKCATPNAFAYHEPADDSFAIGLDPGLQNLFALLFLAARLAVYYGREDWFIDLVNNLVKSHFFGWPIGRLEEGILSLDEVTGPMDRHWADWSGYIAVCFLVGHEVGHMQLGHLQRNQAPRFRMAPDRDSEGEITAFDHQCEFEADEWSANQLIQASDKDLSSRIGACTMPAIFMSLMAMIEDAFLPVDPVGRIQRKSHPPAQERAQRLAKIGTAVVRDRSILVGDIGRLYELPDAIESIRQSWQFQTAAQLTRMLPVMPRARSARISREPKIAFRSWSNIIPRLATWIRQHSGIG